MSYRKLFSLLFATSVFAVTGIPVQDMSSQSLGFDYSFVMQGQTISVSPDASHMIIHDLTLRYTPASWLLLSAGGGVEQFSVDGPDGPAFSGSWGFSPDAGIALVTPMADKFFSVTAGADFQYFWSKVAARDYEGTALNPYIGAIFSIANQVDIGAGCRGNIVNGTTKDSSASSQSFANRHLVQGYVSLTLHNPTAGSYLVVDFGASPEISSDFSRGPMEATIGAALGFILRHDKTTEEIQEKTSRFFPDYKDLEKRQEKMAKETEE